MYQPVSHTTLARGKRRPGTCVLCALALLAAFYTNLSYAQLGTRTLSRSLDQLTAEADLVVHGYITSVRVEPHPQLPNLTTVVVSLRAQEIYQGAWQKSVTFRQYVWDPASGRDAAGYKKGQEILLFLRPVSEYGLTSPVGLEQGRFQVSSDRQGRLVAMNGRGNLGLFGSMAERARSRDLQLSPRALGLAAHTEPGPVPLEDLVDAIRAFARKR